MRELHFSDADEAFAAFRATDLDFLPHAPTRAKWRLGAVELGRSTLWWGRLAAPGAAVGSMPTGGALLVMPGKAAHGWTIDRRSLGAHRIALISPGVDYACSFPVAASWFGLSFPAAWLGPRRGLLAAAGSDEGVSIFDAGRRADRIRRMFSAMRRRLMRDAALLGDARWRAFVQRELFAVLLDAIDPVWEERRRDHRLLGKLLQYLRANRGQPVWIENLCEALATTPRSLRRLFPEAFGTTPGDYLRRRRLLLARRLLLSGAYPSVTAAAVHFGFFDLGRFAAGYRRMFGETPSASLRRTLGDPLRG